MTPTPTRKDAMSDWLRKEAAKLLNDLRSRGDLRDGQAIEVILRHLKEVALRAAEEGNDF